MKVKNILKKFGIVLSSSLLLASATVSPIAYANETHHIIQSHQQLDSNLEEEIILFELEKDFILNELIDNIEEELPEANEIILDANNHYQEQAAWGLLATLFAKYGSNWVRNQLPRIIYSRLAPYIGKYVTQRYFFRLFASICSDLIGWSLRTPIYNLFIRIGLPHGLANTASYIVYYGLLALV